MNIFKKCISYLLGLGLLSFSSVGLSAPNCHQMVARVLESGYEKNIKRALEEKKLVSRNHNRLTVQRPGKSVFEAMNQRAERFFSRVINDNRFPSYYIFDEEQTAPKIIAYVRSLTKSADDNTARNAQGELAPEVRKWIDDYKNYHTQVDDLTKSRVSLAYNYNLLRHYKSEANEFDRVVLNFYRKGNFEQSVFTFRAEDDNLAVLLRDLQTEIKRFDGGLFTPAQRENTRLGFDFPVEGVLRHRVLEQAKLRDKLTLLHRELEFVYQNLGRRAEFSNYTEQGKKQIGEMYREVEALLLDQNLKPSNWASRKMSWQKLKSEFTQSIRSNKRIQQLRERSSVISNYLDENDISRGQLLSRGLGAYSRAAFYSTPGILTVSGLVTMFDLDETISDTYEKYLVWRYGNKMSCVKKSTDQAYIDCLYKHYEDEFPEIIQLAYKDPNFNPWDFELLRQMPFGDELVDRYIADIQEMQKFREYYNYISKRREEIKKLFSEQHQRIVDGVTTSPDDISACIAVSDNQLPVCIYDNIFGSLSAAFGKDDIIDRHDFDHSDYDSVPDEIRDEYINKVEDILFKRAMYSDLDQLDSYQLRIFFND